LLAQGRAQYRIQRLERQSTFAIVETDIAIQFNRLTITYV